VSAAQMFRVKSPQLAKFASNVFGARANFAHCGCSFVTPSFFVQHQSS